MGFERPDRMNGSVRKLKMPCGSLWIIVSLDTKGYPREVFLEGSKAGTCRANLEGEARLCSKLLQLGEWEGAIDALKGIRCPACMRQMGKKIGEGAHEEIKEHPQSCPDALCREIENALNERKEKK